MEHKQSNKKELSAARLAIKIMPQGCRYAEHNQNDIHIIYIGIKISLYLTFHFFVRFFLFASFERKISQYLQQVLRFKCLRGKRKKYQ